MQWYKICNIIAYPLLWFLIVTGAARNSVQTAEIAIIIYLITHTLLWVANGKIAYFLMLTLTFFYGWAIESVLQNIHALFYSSPNTTFTSLAPLWVALLYPLFATSCSIFMGPIKKYTVLAFILGSIFGPLAYYNAFLLGADSFPQGVYYGLFWIALFWGLSFPLIVHLSNTCAWYNKDCPLSQDTLHFEYQSTFPMSVEALFAWHEKPDALELLLPKNGVVKIIRKDPSLEAGSQTELRIDLGWIPIIWVAKHVDYQKNKYFEDIQLKGPFKSWRHRHSFEIAGEDAATLRDTVDFALPFPSLTHPLFGNLAITTLEKMFEERHRVLRQTIVNDNNSSNSNNSNYINNKGQ